MKNKNFPFIPDSYLHNHKKINKVLYSIESATVYSQETPINQIPDLPPGDVPAAPGIIAENEPVEYGYLSVSVFTASGALPVEGAVVTVYVLNENGEEEAISHQVSDASGQIPKIPLPVQRTEAQELSFNTYNLRIQAINYYTVNILGFEIFPNTTTSFNIELIPVAAGPTGISPRQTFVVPPSPSLPLNSSIR